LRFLGPKEKLTTFGGPYSKHGPMGRLIDYFTSKPWVVLKYTKLSEKMNVQSFKKIVLACYKLGIFFLKKK
jgi:hypothetical protein